jgi:ubiquinone/menaquinone biosynthesis C-methylase UbiE
VVSAEKSGVPREFDEVASSYDLFAGLEPGYHRHLRLSAARLGLEGRPRPRILDLCCGTGISTEALREVYPEAEIVGLDASAGMLEHARAKPMLRGIDFVLGDATDPAAAGVRGPFDGILMAYGIRNVPEVDRCLANVRGLLAPGAPICFHEYSVADSFSARAIWEAVCFGIVIPGGLATAGDATIYRYLRRSVVAFDGVRAFEARLSRAGFREVRTLPMDGWQAGLLHSFVAHAPRVAR